MDTGLAVLLPPGSYAWIGPRSGLAYRHFIDVGAGIVDPDFRGEIKVILFNHSVEDFPVQAGDQDRSAHFTAYRHPSNLKSRQSLRIQIAEVMALEARALHSFV